MEKPESFNMLLTTILLARLILLIVRQIQLKLIASFLAACWLVKNSL